VKIVTVANRNLHARLFALLYAIFVLGFGFTVPAAAEPLDERICQSARTDAFDKGAGLTAQPMTIVAVGSSSTEGIIRNAKNKIYPAAMQSALAKLWPQASIQVVNKGKGGETMRETIARFESDVLDCGLRWLFGSWV
jgi:hypothetical protein